MPSSSIYRERFAATLAHQPVDRCPIDLEGTDQTRYMAGAPELAAYLGFTGEAPTTYRRFDERILEHFDTDIRSVAGTLWYHTERDRRVSDVESIDSFGITHRCVGSHWEMSAHPLQGATFDEIAAYEFPTVAQITAPLDMFAEEAQWWYEHSPYVVCGIHPVFGVFELACWLCGFDHLLTMLALDADYIHLLFGKIWAHQQAMIREYYSRIGPFIHFTTAGDDFGVQRGLMISPAMWREFIKPYLKLRIDYTRQFTDAVFWQHTCGAVSDIITDMAEIGVSILNPIQPVVGMAPERLKTDFGQRITFHGGLDTQVVLPSDDFAQIDAAVASLLAAMHPQTDGGFIFAAAHCIQEDVTPRAVTRMYETALRLQGAATK